MKRDHLPSLSPEEFAALVNATAKNAGMSSEQLSKAYLANRADRGQILGERIQRSVIPLFLRDERGRPDRLGSCVLVKVDSNAFAFTAGHVVKQAGASPLWILSKSKGKFLRLPCRIGFHSDHLDIGVIPLLRQQLDAFTEYVFLSGPSEIDEEDRPDGDGFAAFHFLFGYPASRTQFKVDHKPRRIRQRSFQLTTCPPEPNQYAREGSFTTGSPTTGV